MIKEINQKPIRYKEYWVIRIVSEEGNKKNVCREIEYSTEPTEADIVRTLIEIPTYCFVSIEHNYRLLDCHIEI